MDTTKPNVLLFESSVSVASGDSSMPLEGKDEEETKTCWKSVKLVGLLSFLGMIEGGLISSNEWPYMSEIDREATANFFGMASSISKIGKISFALIFSFWTYRTKTVRPPLITGRILATIGCLLYLCVEFLPSGRRYLMLLCYTFFAIASSSAAVLRSYLVAISSNEDRPKAFALFALAATLSLAVGPVFQLAFSWIKYPGYTLIGSVNFNLYTAPVWVSTTLNVLSCFLILFVLEEKLTNSKNIESPGFSLSSLKNLARQLKRQEVPWLLVGLCWLERMVVGLTLGTLITIGAPMNMAIFSWDGQMMVLVSSFSMISCGLLSFVVATVIIKSSITKRVSSRIIFLFAISIIVFLYIGTYPLPGISTSIPLYNGFPLLSKLINLETTGTGCNPVVYSWCTTARATRPFIYIAVTLAVMGLAMPTIHISTDTIFSKILTNIDQTLMQGLTIVLEDIMAIITPIYASEIFTHYGQSPLWITNGTITAVGALLWLLNLRRLRVYH